MWGWRLIDIQAQFVYSLPSCNLACVCLLVPTSINLRVNSEVKHTDGGRSEEMQRGISRRDKDKEREKAIKSEISVGLPPDNREQRQGGKIDLHTQTERSEKLWQLTVSKHTEEDEGMKSSSGCRDLRLLGVGKSLPGVEPATPPRRPSECSWATRRPPPASGRSGPRRSPGPEQTWRQSHRKTYRWTEHFRLFVCFVFITFLNIVLLM